MPRVLSNLAALGFALSLGAGCSQGSSGITQADVVASTASELSNRQVNGEPGVAPAPAHALQLDCSQPPGIGGDHGGRPDGDGDGPGGGGQGCMGPPDGGPPPGADTSTGAHGRHGHGGRHGGGLEWVYDASGDGTLDASEQAAMSADLTAGCEARKARLLAAYDTNGDGTLDATELATAQGALDAEMAARRAEALATYDANGDGTLDETERQTMQDALHAAIIAQYDTNGDGTLDAAEKAALAADIQAQIRDGQHPHLPPL